MRKIQSGGRNQGRQNGAFEGCAAMLDRQANRHEPRSVVVQPVGWEAELVRYFLDRSAGRSIEVGDGVDISGRWPELGEREVGPADDDQILVRLPLAMQLVVEALEPCEEHSRSKRNGAVTVSSGSPQVLGADEKVPG
jgi:hypothetical protein